MRFTSGPRLGSYYVHHGFIYGAKLAFVLLLVVRSPDAIAGPLGAIVAMLVAGAATAFGGWYHDAQAIHAGRIVIEGGADTLAGFAPPTYFAMGATYAGVTLGSWRILAANPDAVAWLLPAALVVMCAVPTSVFLAVDPTSRTSLVNRLTGRSKQEVRT